ncbi:GNAT family N-acetyltransferase [Anaerocolumna sp. AGMB13025]|uniref:GNAT family N-acetyltransferase n=1 Tax=Anaerocolumna sp. AGMB13025 TaxID=3039116 RepID=UPI00241D8CD5|nr:GNAT family N-acetyltransferase [Anaerocolumna sp. AGMB13025]WFR59306.1 GNAT family N-acetyltransferase [Anaerocolumna sp. AGMB13025]
MNLRTDRLIIRDFEKKDAAGLFEILKNPPVNCFMRDKLNSLDEAEKEVEHRSKEGGHFAVCLSDKDFIIGDLFAMKEEPDTYSVGWNFNLNFGGKGYATEAAKALMEHLFHSDARRIYAYAEDDNYASQKLCERLGMRKEGLFTEFISFINNPDGTPHYENTYQYAILKREWMER